MHAVFMVSGIRRIVDEYFDWLDYHLFNLPFKNPKMLPLIKDMSGNILKEGFIPVTGRVRYGVYGTYEICFPKEDMDLVLTTLRFNQDNITKDAKTINKVKGVLGNMEIATFRKLLGCEPIPEFKTDRIIPIPESVTNNLRIIPVGVRYDIEDWKSPSGLTHERI